MPPMQFMITMFMIKLEKLLRQSPLLPGTVLEDWRTGLKITVLDSDRLFIECCGHHETWHKASLLTDPAVLDQEPAHLR